MSRLKVNFKGSVTSRAEASSKLSSPGDTVLIDRGYPRWLVMKCPDGCGDELPINLDGRAGPAWRLYRTPRLGLTVYPSVWRDTGCESHFIIWRDNILLFGGKSDDDSEYDVFWEDQAFDKLRDAVLERLPRDKLIHFADVAEDLNEIPWDVLKACRQLVNKKLAAEGVKKQRQHFKRL